jgi:hypothetical protein
MAQDNNLTPKQPTQNKAAIYARKATLEKTVNEVDLFIVVRHLGWNDEQIMSFQDNGQPGSAPIERREGLQALLTAIEQGTIKSVFIINERCLFTSVEASELDTFIQCCVAHDVCVVTPDTLYNFCNPAHVKLFRFMLETGAITLSVYSRIAISKRFRQEQGRKLAQEK